MRVAYLVAIAGVLCVGSGRAMGQLYNPQLFSSKMLQRSFEQNNLNFGIIRNMVNGAAVRGTAKGSVAKGSPPASSSYLLPAKIASEIKGMNAEKTKVKAILSSLLDKYVAYENRNRFDPNKLSAAVAFYVYENYKVYSHFYRNRVDSSISSSEFPGYIPYASEKAFYDQFGTGFSSTSEFSKLTPEQSKIFREMFALMATMTMARYEAAINSKNQEEIGAAREAASDNIKALLGVGPEKLTFTSEGLKINK